MAQERRDRCRDPKPDVRGPAGGLRLSIVSAARHGPQSVWLLTRVAPVRQVIAAVGFMMLALLTSRCGGHTGRSNGVPSTGASGGDSTGGSGGSTDVGLEHFAGASGDAQGVDGAEGGRAGFAGLGLAGAASRCGEAELADLEAYLRDALDAEVLECVDLMVYARDEGSRLAWVPTFSGYSNPASPSDFCSPSPYQDAVLQALAQAEPPECAYDRQPVRIEGAARAQLRELRALVEQCGLTM